MTAIAVVQQQGDLVVAEIEIPQLLAHQAYISVEYAAFNTTDSMFSNSLLLVTANTKRGWLLTFMLSKTVPSLAVKVVPVFVLYVLLAVSCGACSNASNPWSRRWYRDWACEVVPKA